MSLSGLFERKQSSDIFAMDRFLELPRELRDIVYSFVPVPNEPMILRDAFNAGLTGREVPAEHAARLGAEMLRGLRAEPRFGLFFSSRRVAREAAPALFVRHVCCFDCPNGDWRDLNVFLRAIGPVNTRYLRTLQVDAELPSGPGAHSVDAMRPEFEILFRRLAEHGRNVHLVIDTKDFLVGEYGQNWARTLQSAVKTNQRLAGVDGRGRERVQVTWQGFGRVRSVEGAQ